MTPRIERALWTLTGTCVLLAVGLVRYAVPTTGPAARHADAAAVAVRAFDHDRLAELADRAVEHNPFRLDRRPSDVLAGEPPVEVASITPPPVPMPTVSLKGVIGGPPWQAVLGGVPDHAGDVVVRTGDSVAGLHIRHVSPSRVVLAGPDSSITLTPNHAWP